MTKNFNLTSSYQPSGDQQKAINSLILGLNKNYRNQVLLGVTGSGKTFTMANVINKINKPTLIMAPNKILAAQLYSEMKYFFPDNAVEYFVSYFDYYQPEAYVAKTNTYIEKDSLINVEIERMRHSATQAIIDRKDVIIVASVSCIYGLGDNTNYVEMSIALTVNQIIKPQYLIQELTNMQYKRKDSLSRGAFCVRGDTITIFPVQYENTAWRIEFFDDYIESISTISVLENKTIKPLEYIKIYPNSHFAAKKSTMDAAIKSIKEELRERLAQLEAENKMLEYQRLYDKTTFDIEMLVTTSHCKGIENYSRWLNNKKSGHPPPTFFDYMPKDALLIIDESHISVPQIGGMFKGDHNRKSNLVEHGFRLPSCLDNRPLKFDEWEKIRPNTIFVSATPNEWELNISNNTIEQVIRPTGLLDPICIVRSSDNQIDNIIMEINQTTQAGYCCLVTVLTKKMAEQLTEYLLEHAIKVKYIHADIDTLERIEIIKELRGGKFNVLIGINLLREGLDIPECQLVIIVDADKEGFLRSYKSLIQIIGRAARNENGKVIMYADNITNSMQQALDETERRRQKQTEYNKKNNIIPKSAIAPLNYHNSTVKQEDSDIVGTNIAELENDMMLAASNLDFEQAIKIRNRINYLNNQHKITKNKNNIN